MFRFKCMSCVAIALVLLSTRAEAESFFSRFEYRSFWWDVLPIIVMSVVAVVVTWLLVRKILQQAASAPPEAIRSPQERLLHLLSLPFIAGPMFYAYLFDVDLMFPVFAIMVVQTLVLMGARVVRLPFDWKLACILPAGVLSIFAAELVASWPNLTLSLPAGQAWVLTACAVSHALGMLLSNLSFPPAYRARVW